MRVYCSHVPTHPPAAAVPPPHHHRRWPGCGAGWRGCHWLSPSGALRMSMENSAGQVPPWPVSASLQGVTVTDTATERSACQAQCAGPACAPHRYLCADTVSAEPHALPAGWQVCMLCWPSQGAVQGSHRTLHGMRALSGCVLISRCSAGGRLSTCSAGGGQPCLPYCGNLGCPALLLPQCSRLLAATNMPCCCPCSISCTPREACTVAPLLSAPVLCRLSLLAMAFAAAEAARSCALCSKQRQHKCSVAACRLRPAPGVC